MTCRALVASVLSVVLLGVVGSPAGATDVDLQPFPPGDDQIRLFGELYLPICAPDRVISVEHIVHRENVPADAQVYTRHISGGVAYADQGPLAPGILAGTGISVFAGTHFDEQPYPTTVGWLYKVVVDGIPTYLGGTTITCAAAGATPVVEHVESFAPPCRAGEPAIFPDVPAGHPFCADVVRAVQRGIVGGYTDGLFRPTVAVSRQAMAAFLYRAAGEPEGPDPSCEADPFPDVPATNGFCGEIRWMSDEGIAGGFTDGTFGPTVAVSRQSMALFLYRWVGSPRGDDPVCSAPAFSDVPAGHPFCGEIDWLADAGVTGGYTDGSYRPALPVSRQSMAAFLVRMLSP